MDKAQRKEAIRERARAALRDLYHNATISYPREDYGREKHFDAWLQDLCEQEIDYVRSGGAYGKNYRATLAAPCNAGKYKSERARAYYVAKGMRAMQEERADCGMVTGWIQMEATAGNPRLGLIFAKYPFATRNDSQWERITEWGELFTYGRGGRTLAPSRLIRERGPRFSVAEDYADDKPLEDVVDLIRVVESFNRYVAAWCKSVPEQWADYCKDLAREERAERKRAREQAKEDARRAALIRCFIS